MGCSASRPNTVLSKNKNNNDPLEENHSLDYSFLTTSSQHSPSPMPRALSLQTPLVHHPPSRKGDSHHLVSLTSTTYGSLLLIEPITHPKFPDQTQSPQKSTINSNKTLIPADPGESLSPDSVINTWELMDGLDELDFEMGNSNSNKKSSISDDYVLISPKSNSFHHLGFDESVKKLNDSFDFVKSEEIEVDKSFSLSKPLWKHLSEESFLSNMDPNVVSSYRRALSSRQLGYTKESKSIKSVGSSPINSSFKNGFIFQDNKIVLYYTSLRGIRKTYEDCCAVRMIFRGFRVPVDERDISMDSSYRKELQSMLKGKAMSLPQVFIRENHIGGVEEIKQLNETGELAKLLEGFPVKDPKFVCESCGDARFLPCPNCNGSRKVFDLEEDKLRRCQDCNENGLIRCPCCS
ncbi:hypothetical protein JCGZ_22485 [Jatropha curcas]|uniref:Glutaredoxin domain-containing protein n=1 Tax=Jatropha curcas TaxID=180498 RepID=A0A067K391_JATCU|nr:uncharacterized protein At5g39865 [Jatropha curcas]KDP26239.1 hypothetical protein JCGZ_22485 [Jatropha curcas]